MSCSGVKSRYPDRRTSAQMGQRFFPLVHTDQIILTLMGWPAAQVLVFAEKSPPLFAIHVFLVPLIGVDVGNR